MLSRRPDADKGEEDNQNLTLLPPHLFVQLMMEGMEPPQDWIDLERAIARAQKRFLQLILKWGKKRPIRLEPSDTVPGLKLWNAHRKFVIPPEESLKRDIQWVKKLSQCLAVLERLTWHKSSKLCNNLKIIYVILGYLSFQISLNARDLEQN
jgi:hypothetical protein